MKQVLIFTAGMILGALLLYAIGFRSESSIKEQVKQDLIETLSQSIERLNESAEVQYVEIRGKKGDVTLYTGMPKDSVRLLVGKPDEIDLNKIGNVSYEKWGYKLNSQYVSDLDIDFRDGRLKGIRQN